MNHADVIVTGGSGYLGEFVLREFQRSGVSALVLCRSDAARHRVERYGASAIRWDLDTPEDPPVRGRVLLHLAGIRYGSSLPRWVEACNAEQVVCVSSASATVPGHPNEQMVLRGEMDAASSPAQTTIVRPTMIFGGSRDRNVQVVYRALTRAPFVPRISGGQKIQPVLVDDLAGVLAELVQSASASARGTTLDYGGKTAVSLGRLVSDVSGLLGKRVMPLSIPVGRLARLLRASHMDTYHRYLHALSMLDSERVAADPDSMGFARRATEWPAALQLAVDRYRKGAD